MTLKGTKHPESVKHLCVWKTTSPHLCSPVPGTAAAAVENALTVVGFTHQTPFLATELIFRHTARVHCSQFSYFWSPRSRTPAPHPAPGVILLGSLQLVTISRRAATLCLKKSRDCRGRLQSFLGMGRLWQSRAPHFAWLRPKPHPAPLPLSFLPSFHVHVYVVCVCVSTCGHI